MKRKYRLLFTPKRRGKPGPQGPAPALIAVIVEMKRRNPRFGCRRIAQQISFTFGVDADKDVVRRVLAKYYRPDPGDYGPSRLTFLGHSKDSLWSIDLFRCESMIFRTYWVMVVMITSLGESSASACRQVCSMGLRSADYSTRRSPGRCSGFK